MKLSLAFGLFAVASTPITKVAAQGKPTSLSIVHVNDHHSSFDTTTLDVAGSLVPPLSVNTSKVRLSYGGFGRMISVINGYQSAANAAGRDTLRLHAGDMITGSIYYTLLGVAPDAAVMNAANFDAVTIGNHEFDNGDTNLANLLNAINNTAILSANLVPSATSALRTLTNSHAIQPFFVKTLSNGEKVGVCGVTIMGETLELSTPDQGTNLLDERVTASNCVVELQAMGINKIVMLTHIGYSNDIAWMTQIPGVDVVVGGHSHTLLADSSYTKFGLPVAGPYAAMTNGVCVVQAWSYSQAAGRVDIEFDTNGVVQSCNGTAQLPLDPDHFQVRDAVTPYYVNPSDAAILTKFYTSYAPFLAAQEDAGVAAALAPFRNQLGAAQRQVIATATENICHTYTATDLKCSDRPVSSILGGGLCNLVSQGFLYNTPTADLAIQNRGGCRKGIDIAQGPFTYGNAFTILPFTNVLVTLKVTGDQLRRAMEDALNYMLDPNLGGTGGSYPLGAGIRWSVDFTKPFGYRYTNIEVNKQLADKWVTLDLNASYTVVTNDYVAATKDNYLAFGEVNVNDPSQYVNTYIGYAQSLVDFSEHLGTLSDPSLNTFSTQSVTILNGTTYSTPRYPVCKVCTSAIQNPAATLSLSGQSPTACADVQASGLAGQIAPATCTALKTVVPSICGCPTCVDAPGRVVKTGRYGHVSCDFLVSHPRQKRGVCKSYRNVCPVTCGACPKT